MSIFWIVLGWAICSFLAVGALIADFKGEVDENDFPPSSLLAWIAISGPAGLLSACVATSRGLQEWHHPFYHGFKWRR